MSRTLTIRCCQAVAALLLLAPGLLGAQIPLGSASPPRPDAGPQRNMPWADLYPPLPSEQDTKFGFPAQPDLNGPVPIQAPATVVSAETLRHPLTKKGRKLLARAQDDSHSGNHAKAIRELNSALEEQSAEPYAHSLLGVEYLRLHQAAAAIRELVLAARQLPRLASVHSNLGLALCESGQVEQGLHEVDTALNLDQAAVKPHFLTGVILLEQGHADHETWSNLAAAEKELPSARLALAIYYARQGQSNAAEQQLQNYTASIRGVTLPYLEQWLEHALSGVPPAEALGLWGHPPDLAR